MSSSAHATLAAPFWAAEVSSAAQPDGAVRSLPFAPPPLAQLAPSGLNRAQARPSRRRRRPPQRHKAAAAARARAFGQPQRL